MSATETEYVPRELFDIHLQSIRDRANSDKEVSDERLEKFQAVMEKNFATLQGQINVLSEKIDHVADTLGVAIDGTNNRIDNVEKRIDDLHHSHNIWFAILGFFAAAVPVAIAIVQYIMSK